MEHYWNGTILNTIDHALQWANNMTWKGIAPFVHLVEGIYPKQISVPKNELAGYEQKWQRAEALPKWDVSIAPT